MSSIKIKLNELIPGGCHTYSKGLDTFPSNVPAVISKGKGAYVWDNNDKKFLDFTMGLTSVTLGHAFDAIDDKVIETLKEGLNFQRPSWLELEYAEEFLNLLPQHQMIKFAKNGSTVTSAATKIARAFTGRDLIAFPKQHPFFSYDDWFIGKTKCDFGVPSVISNLSVTFDSCSLSSLEELFETYPNQIACVIMEPIKPTCYGCSCSISNTEYLKEAIALVHRHGALFILDEMITGYKASFPGVTSKDNLDTDITTWGKSISNGYAFSCMTGKKEIMSIGGIEQKGARKLFLTSTTHGAETIGIRGALETLRFYKNNKVVEHIDTMGRLMINSILSRLESHDLQNHIIIKESPWLILFEFRNNKLERCLKHHTLFSQEMIKKNILIQSGIIISYSHSQKEIKLFVEAFDEFLKLYKTVLIKGVDRFLEGEAIQPVFRKYI